MTMLHTPGVFRPIAGGRGASLHECTVCGAVQAWPLPNDVASGAERRWFVNGHNVGGECMGRPYTQFERDAMTAAEADKRVMISPGRTATAVHAAGPYGPLVTGERYRLSRVEVREGYVNHPIVVGGVLVGVVLDGQVFMLGPHDRIEAL